MATDFRSSPGYYADRTLRTRNIFTNRTQFVPQFAPSIAQIDGTLARDTGETPTGHLRAGLLMGKITTGGLYRNSIIGLLGTAITSGTKTSVTSSAVVVAEIARLIALAAGNVSLKLTGPPTAGGTNATTAITATAASGTTITVSSVAIPDMVGPSIITPADGSETPTNIVSPADGIECVDINGSISKLNLNLLRGADLIATQIINLTESDASVQAILKTNLRAVGSFTFDNDR